MRCIYYTVFEIYDSHVGEESSSSHYSGKLWSLPNGTYLFQVLGSSLRIPCQALPVHKPLHQILYRHAVLKAMSQNIQTKHSTFTCDSATLWNLRNCPAIGQDKTNRSSQKKHMQKSKIYHIHNLILYSPWLSMVVTWATKKNQIFSPVGSMLPTRIGSYWILWTDIAIDHLVFPHVHRCLFFVKWLRQ